MKRTFSLLFLMLLAVPVVAQYSLTGRVTANGTPLEFATIIVGGTDVGAMTTTNGNYRIDNVPLGICEIIASHVGYETRRIKINVSSDVAVNIVLDAGDAELNVVVVSGVSKATRIKENPLAIESVSMKQIEQEAENNVIDAVAKNAPGFQVVKTGPNVSKPFINGLGYNRVLTLYDGLRVETQQWGDEHGVPLDDYIIARAEVIKGPASLMYGSDAIAGVLSLFPAIPKDTDRLVHGKVLSEYQTNNGLIGNSLSLYARNLHWCWAVRGSERLARNYVNAVDGRVYNTGFKMVNGSGFLGYASKRGYSHLNVTFYDNRQGIPDGSRDSLTRKFTYQVYESAGENIVLPQVDIITKRPTVTANMLNAYQLSPLSQRIQDYRLYTNHFYNLGKGDVTALLGFEQNVRREFDHPTNATQAGEYIVLNTISYGFKYNAPPVLGLEPSVGVTGMYQANANKNATDFPIPDYHLFDMGAYVYGMWKHKRWTVAAGVRFDHRTETGQDMYVKPDPATGFYRQVSSHDTVGARQPFSAFKLQLQGISGSIGATYHVNEAISIKTNIARGYRTPNITEIASNGLDPGAHIYYEGNLNFKPEFSLQEDAGILADYANLSFSISIFHNYIQHYIYEDQKVDANGNAIVIVPGNKTFQYQQTNARLHGGDAMIDVHPGQWHAFHFINTFSLVYGENLDKKYQGAGTQGQYLPFIPPPKVLSSISYDLSFPNRALSMITFKAGIDYNAAQNRYLGLYNTETATPAYTLLNASAHTEIKYTPKHTLQCLIAVNNVLNTAYQSHLSRLQYFEYYTASPNGRQGIYDMGRNVCFKITMAF